MESHARMERGQTTDKKHKTTNHIALPSRQVSSLIINDNFNINTPVNGAITLNREEKGKYARHNKTKKVILKV